MTKLWKYIPLVLVILGAGTFRVMSDYALTQGAGTTFIAFDGTHGGTARCAAANAQCSGVTLQNSAGTEVGNATTPLQVSLANTGANGTALSVSGTVTANQGGTWTVQPGNTANTTPWLAKIGDGTNVAAIKGASTAPIAGDSSLVVTISPNSPSPALATGAATSANQTSEITQLTTIATNTGAAIPSCSGTPCTTIIGVTSNDPCTNLTKLGATINLTASGQLITGTAAKKTYICSINIMVTTAGTAALVEGTGTTCATNIFGLAGGTTAATGWPIPATGGLTQGSGNGTVISPSADTNATAANVCLLLASTGQTSGHITYVQQ